MTAIALHAAIVLSATIALICISSLYRDVRWCIKHRKSLSDKD